MEFIDAGANVVVAVRHVAKGKASGVDVDMQTFQVWTVRDGKVIRYRSFDDRQTALAAVELQE